MIPQSLSYVDAAEIRALKDRLNKLSKEQLQALLIECYSEKEEAQLRYLASQELYYPAQ